VNLEALIKMIILQILGGILLAIIVIAGVIYLYYRLKFGKYLNHDTNQEPLFIHLVEDVSPDWLDNKNIIKKIKELEDLGFCRGKAYSIYEIDDVLLHVFFKDNITSVLYFHNIAGYWVDMVVEEKNGKEYTFSNAPMGSGMEHRPECKKMFDSTASIRSLYERIVNITKNQDIKFLSINENNFREYFELAYKKDISWKNRNGGISYEEFLKTEKEAPFTSSKKKIEEAFITTKEAELHQWNDAAIDEYCRSEGLKEEDSYDLEYKLIIVPYVTNAAAFIRYLESKDFLNNHQSEKLEKIYSNETDIYEIFEKINTLFSPELRAEYVKEIKFPLNIKIYRLSEGMCG